jgi:pSer/pThr/pTyr-binding forkhead associated (FHA) protein
VAKAPRPVLVVRWKGARQREEVCYLATGLSIIGRGSESEILLLEKSISRRHASLRLEDGEAYLTDLESGNGCYVNGERLPPVDPRKLNDGDVIRLGELEMVYWSMRPRSDD